METAFPDINRILSNLDRGWPHGAATVSTGTARQDAHGRRSKNYHRQEPHGPHKGCNGFDEKVLVFVTEMPENRSAARLASQFLRLLGVLCDIFSAVLARHAVVVEISLGSLPDRTMKIVERRYRLSRSAGPAPPPRARARVATGGARNRRDAPAPGSPAKHLDPHRGQCRVAARVLPSGCGTRGVSKFLLSTPRLCGKLIPPPKQ
jgi:hypothetical protein